MENKRTYEDEHWNFVKWYIHWKTGKKMVASDYGYEAWKFPKKSKKKRK